MEAIAHIAFREWLVVNGEVLALFCSLLIPYHSGVEKPLIKPASVSLWSQVSKITLPLTGHCFATDASGFKIAIPVMLL